ncbi:hypothetical protein H2201_002030 [Coniosporium apollinis]|uniref:Uncharacterized protein n=1 Tax=Coniosporium apollinis TaxID=61459 RepID=A0ABQ9NZR3_9PEZI|nr:hypothetical protein H2201_002030 [Coniosporium apollinis]
MSTMEQNDATNVFRRSTPACEHGAMTLGAPGAAMPAPGFLHQAPGTQLYAPSPEFAGTVRVPTAPGHVAPAQELQQQVRNTPPYSVTPSIGPQFYRQQHSVQSSVQLSSSYGGPCHAPSPYSSPYPMNNAVHNPPLWHFHGTYDASVYGSPYAPTHTHTLSPAYAAHPPAPTHDMSGNFSPRGYHPHPSTPRPQQQTQHQNQDQPRSPYAHSPYAEPTRPCIDSKDDQQQPASQRPPSTGRKRSFAETQHASPHAMAQQAPSPLHSRDNAPSPHLPPSPFPTHSAAPTPHPPLQAAPQAPPPYPAHSAPPSPRPYMLPPHLQPIKEGRCVPPPIPRPAEVPEPIWELWLGVALNQFMNEQPETAYQQAVRRIRSQVKWEEWKKWEEYKAERLGPRQQAQLERASTRARAGGRNQTRGGTVLMKDADGKVEMFQRASFPDVAALAAEGERTMKKKMLEMAPVAL